MKTLNALLFFCLISTLSYAQIKLDTGSSTVGNSNTCGNCSDSNNDITIVDNDTFRARSAQAYWWEICDGNATIVGSNISRNVNISCVSGQTSTIKLTRFYNGDCIESCQTFTCTGGGGDECEASVREIWCNPSSGPFSGAYPMLVSVRFELTNPFPNSASGHARWNSNLASGQMDTGGVFGNLSSSANDLVFPSQFFINLPLASGNNPSGFYVPLEVYYEDNVTGENCTVTFSALIDEPCGTGDGEMRTANIKDSIKLYPNPAKSNDEIEFEGINNRNIEIVEIIDFTGNTIQSLKPKSNVLKTTNLKSGLYFVRFTTKKGETIQKRLAIK